MNQLPLQLVTRPGTLPGMDLCRRPSTPVPLSLCWTPERSPGQDSPIDPSGGAIVCLRLSVSGSHQPVCQVLDSIWPKTWPWQPVPKPLSQFLTLIPPVACMFKPVSLSDSLPVTASGSKCCQATTLTAMLSRQGSHVPTCAMIHCNLQQNHIAILLN